MFHLKASSELPTISAFFLKLLSLTKHGLATCFLCCILRETCFAEGGKLFPELQFHMQRRQRPQQSDAARHQSERRSSGNKGRRDIGKPSSGRPWRRWRRSANTWLESHRSFGRRGWRPRQAADQFPNIFLTDRRTHRNRIETLSKAFSNVFLDTDQKCFGNASRHIENTSRTHRKNNMKIVVYCQGKAKRESQNSAYLCDSRCKINFRLSSNPYLGAARTGLRRDPGLQK